VPVAPAGDSCVVLANVLPGARRSERTFHAIGIGGFGQPEAIRHALHMGFDRDPRCPDGVANPAAAVRRRVERQSTRAS